MFKLIVVSALVACIAANVAPKVEDSEVLKQLNDVRADGFESVLELANHIHQDAKGNEHGDISGSFGWISPEGDHIEIKYVADENGYQPQGDVLPTPPPVPEPIARAVEYLRTHAVKDTKNY